MEFLTLCPKGLFLVFEIDLLNELCLVEDGEGILNKSNEYLVVVVAVGGGERGRLE